MDQSRPATAAITGKFGVRIPRMLRDTSTVCDTQIAVYTAIASRVGEQPTPISHAKISHILGGLSTDRIGGAITALMAGGWVTRTRVPHTNTWLYSLPKHPTGTDRWDVIQWPVLEALSAVKGGYKHIRAWLNIDQALGTSGHSSKSLTDLAASANVSTQTMRRHIQALEASSVLHVERPAGKAWTLHRTPPAPQPAEVEPTPIENAGRGVSKTRVGGYQKRGSYKDLLAPKKLASKPLAKSCSFELCEDRYVTNARDADDALRAKTGDDRDGGEAEQAPVIEARGSRSKPARTAAVPDHVAATRRLDVAEVLANAPSDLIPAWQRRYKPGVAQTIADVLDAGMPAPIVASALHRLVDATATGGKILPAIRYALTTAANEHRCGLLCAQCGDPHQARGCTPGQCATTALVEETEIDPAVLAAVHAHLGITNAS